MLAVVQDVESGAEKAREAGDGLRRIELLLEQFRLLPLTKN